MSYERTSHQIASCRVTGVMASESQPQPQPPSGQGRSALPTATLKRLGSEAEAHEWGGIAA